MTTVQIPVTQFKAQCTKLLREVAASNQAIEVTKHGAVLAVVAPPKKKQGKPKKNPFMGCLKGTVTYLPGWDEPLDPKMWEAVVDVSSGYKCLDLVCRCHGKNPS